MDIHPGMSGSEVSRHIRGDAGNLNARTPIIALTARVSPEEVRHYLANGMNAVVAKPVRIEHLLRTLADAQGVTEPAVPAGAVDTRLLTARVFGNSRVMKLLRPLREQVAEVLSQIAAALEQGDLFEVQELAHKLAGACEMLGLVASGEQLRMLEARAGLTILEGVAPWGRN
ncbi:response regulator [Azoarcus sp. KH32C]|uniref:response regulator n=1 Tax=Azoarcus sp. KH32C TaxID=748247 RepID=UPI00155B14C0|nr:response regulator [Azoarcus sp. KH32C]